MFHFFKTSFVLLFCLFTQTQGFSQTSLVDSFMHGGEYRSFRIYIPATYDGSKAVPLVFNLHGFTSNALEQENYGDFRKIADTANFILVHPNGSNIILSYKGWNTFGTLGTGADDLGFINSLLDTMATRYNINTNRVYATGMSNGGFMSYELACFMSERIAAIASVAGNMTEERRIKCDALHPTPVMQIHGTADATVGYDGTNYVSGSPSFTHIDSLMAYWVRFNHCSLSPSMTAVPDISSTDDCTAEHYVWSGGDEGSSVELYKVVGGEHTWPGSAYKVGVTNQDFDASKEIWRFFNQYSLDQFSMSIKTLGKSEAFTISPNPASTFIRINFTTPTNASVKLFNQLGQILQSTTMQGSAQELRIERADYPAGIYYIQITTKDNSLTKQVLFN